MILIVLNCSSPKKPGGNLDNYIPFGSPGVFLLQRLLFILLSLYAEPYFEDDSKSFSEFYISSDYWAVLYLLLCKSLLTCSSISAYYSVYIEEEFDL